jgi:hypothetical protein
MTRSATVVLLAVVALLGAATAASGGWRSADRWSPEDEVEVREPCEEEAAPAHHFRLERRFDDVRDLSPPVATQPYWGTMRPYWNAPEPPGVIHRGLRTRDLKK